MSLNRTNSVPVLIHRRPHLHVSMIPSLQLNFSVNHHDCSISHIPFLVPTSFLISDVLNETKIDCVSCSVAIKEFGRKLNSEI